MLKDKVANWFRNGIEATNAPNKKEIETLAKYLQYIPLDLQDAISLIDENCGIYDYLKDKVRKNKEKHLKTAWQTTIEAITKKGIDGDNASQKLIIDQNNEIHHQMLLPSFNSNSKLVSSVILLFERYFVLKKVRKGFSKINSLCQAFVGVKTKSLIPSLH